MGRRALAIVVVLAACGGGKGASGETSASEVLSCLKSHGLQASSRSPTAARATTTLEASIKEPPTGAGAFGPTLFIDFFPTAPDAQNYFDAHPSIETVQRLSQKVLAVYGPEYGLRGPPELQTVRGCLGS